MSIGAIIENLGADANSMSGQHAALQLQSRREKSVIRDVLFIYSRLSNIGSRDQRFVSAQELEKALGRN